MSSVIEQLSTQRKPIGVACACVVGVRLIQLLRIIMHYAPPISPNNLMGVDTYSLAAFVIAPLFLYMQLEVLRASFCDYIITRQPSIASAVIGYIKQSAFSSLIIVLLVQMSGLGVLVSLGVPLDLQEVLMFAVGLSCMLIFYYMVVACVLLLGLMLSGSIIMSLGLTALFLVWDYVAMHTPVLVQHDIYLGWKVFRWVLSEPHDMSVLCFWRFFALAMFIITALVIVSLHVPAERLIHKSHARHSGVH